MGKDLLGDKCSSDTERFGPLAPLPKKVVPKGARQMANLLPLGRPMNGGTGRQWRVDARWRRTQAGNSFFAPEAHALLRMSLFLLMNTEEGSNVKRDCSKKPRFVC